MISGRLTVANTSVDLSEEEVQIRWGDFTVILPAENLFSVGRQEIVKYKKSKGGDGSVAAAIFDLGKGTFKIVIKNADIGPQDEPIEFGISFDGFAESVEI